ncbi:unnamed protein product [Trifolium pratense]|uniref:Uncharacterized protein n=1 Tax=Trifolium pratense TaxID=57577 RepID=A0ACB0LSN3_TRIPR|nr:unnamed protein product [Trifolium pratense]
MAESFVFNIADSLLGKLASYAYEEASRAYGVYEDLQGIKDTLSIVRGLLLDAEHKKNQQHALREWLRQIQNICYDAEDVLDEFELQHKKKQDLEVSGSTRRKVRRFFSPSNPLAFRFKMARQIKEIRDRLNKVAADGTMFGLVKIDVEPEHSLQRRQFTHSHVDASSVIGRENDKETIIKLLMESNPRSDGDKCMCVIPIVGIGGLGKTTLAKLVFNDKRIDDVFQLKIWVCVSNDFDIRKIIIKIINSAFLSASPPPGVAIAHQEDINHFDIEQLQIRLRHKLDGQKFILVLDDIWNDDRTKWIELADMIRVGAGESKIIVTTRSNSIASMMGNVPSYLLEGLSQKNCLSLFVKCAFKDGEEEKYSNLVETGKEIVKKCAGVPLAVKTLGSSLFSKYDLNKWIFIRDHEIWNLEQKKDDILPALKLSYDEMSSYLRQCFAYFSMYPKNRSIDVIEITTLWMAHGLVKSTNEFVTVDSNTRKISEQARHISIIENDSLDRVLFPKSKSVRTILFPVEGVGLDNESLLDIWVSRYKYLRFLDLDYSSVETLPNSIGKLKHLHILFVSNNKKIKRLPDSIFELHKLQYLALNGCPELETLPRGLGKLTSLRHLWITTKQSVLSLTEFANLINLQLLVFEDCKNMKFVFNGAQQLTSIETLYLDNCGSLESLPLYIFPKLQSLAIRSSKMLNLSLHNESPVQKLMLKHLLIDNIPRLLTLPGWIEGAAETLEILRIYELPNLQTFPECLTTMTHLKRLIIRGCPKLSSLPSGIHNLTALEELYIDGCPELCRKCQPQSGEYWPMIAHIKSIIIKEEEEEEEDEEEEE